MMDSIATIVRALCSLTMSAVISGCVGDDTTGKAANDASPHSQVIVVPQGAENTQQLNDSSAALTLAEPSAILSPLADDTTAAAVSTGTGASDSALPGEYSFAPVNDVKPVEDSDESSGVADPDTDSSPIDASNAANSTAGDAPADANDSEHSSQANEIAIDESAAPSDHDEGASNELADPLASDENSSDAVDAAIEPSSDDGGTPAANDIPPHANDDPPENTPDSDNTEAGGAVDPSNDQNGSGPNAADASNDQPAGAAEATSDPLDNQADTDELSVAQNENESEAAEPVNDQHQSVSDTADASNDSPDGAPDIADTSNQPNESESDNPAEPAAAGNDAADALIDDDDTPPTPADNTDPADAPVTDLPSDSGNAAAQPDSTAGNDADIEDAASTADPAPTSADPPPVAIQAQNDVAPVVAADGMIPAFPGAEGYGAIARGGRGGVVVKVSNLNDAGPGSLRAALMMTEPRMIVFDVSGTIELQQQIRLHEENSYFTLAGQTAPGDGIAIRIHKLVFDGVRQGVVRHLRLRHGCEVGCNVAVADNLTLLGDTSLMIFDHLSMTWAEDEVLDVWGDDITDITFQWSILGEGTHFCIDGASQNLGPLTGGGDGIRNVTFANNFIAHTCYRNFMQSAGRVSYLNNLNYNTFKLDFSFSLHPRSTEQIHADIVGHHFREGPQTDNRFPIDIINAVGSEPRDPVSLHLRDLSVFTISGDVHPDYIDDPYSLISTRSLGSNVLPEWERRDHPLTPPRFPVSLVTSARVPDKILGTVGASLPKRDNVDSRLVDSFYTLGGWDSSNVGQYPLLQTYDLRTDNDNDGMSDAWETRNGLDPLDSNDHAGDINNDGYTNIENYINSL